MKFKIIISRREVNRVRMITPPPNRVHRVKSKYTRKIKHLKRDNQNS
jgi:hypothetical protein